MRMIDKREPYHGSVKANSANNDAIIELTDEVIPKPEEDSGVLELSDDLIVDAPKTDAADAGSEVDDDILTLDEQDDFESPKDEVLFGLDDEDADDDSKMADNEIIASAIEESFGFDDDEDFTPTDEFNLKDPDDEDVVIVDNAPHDQDEGLAAISGDGGADTQKEEDIFDLEKEIEIEYELDDDEDEMIPIDDERGENYQDFVSMVFGESGKSKPADRSEEPTEYIDLGKGEPNDMLGFEVDQKEEAEIIAETDDETEPQFDDGDGLPDLESITELEFEDDDEDDVISLDEETVENSDDIIARTVEQSLGAEQEAERIKPAEKFEFESDDGDDLLALDEDRQEDEEILSLAEEETLEFAKGGDLLDLDAEDEIIPLDGAPDLDDEKNEDIIEITEFDHHFSEEGETLFEQAGLLKASHPEEEDFLELIELEDDSPAQDENMTGFGEAAEKIEYATVNRFFNEALEEDGPEENLNKPSVFKTALAAENTETEAADPFFTDVLNQESDFGDDLAQGEAENFGAESDLKTEASTPSSEDERFDFDFDPGAIAQQVDRLDTFLSEDSSAEPEAASLPADQADEALPITPGQIDAAIERVISEKFSGKIENIIYEVIEKAVSKEIEHLKGVLLGNTRPDEDQ